MTILCDSDLRLLADAGLIKDFDEQYLNPASIDIRIGNVALVEMNYGELRQRMNLEYGPLIVPPGGFALVDTLEWFEVPNGYAMDLRLKSSTARRGWDHSLAFWVDPGWQGRLTMEVKNNLQYNPLRLERGARFAQVIVHRLSGPSSRPYAGRYNGATEVEGVKG